jgi:two-component system chemotaxis response regulator CheY
VEAGDGEQAVLKYEEEKPGVVLLDITMPVMDGIQVLRTIKQLDPNAKVIMCSAMGQEGMVVEAIKLGALDFIVKPFKPERLVQTVKNVLG